MKQMGRHPNISSPDDTACLHGNCRAEPLLADMYSECFPIRRRSTSEGRPTLADSQAPSI